jgi:hypothetical protein
VFRRSPYRKPNAEARACGAKRNTPGFLGSLSQESLILIATGSVFLPPHCAVARHACASPHTAGACGTSAASRCNAEIPPKPWTFGEGHGLARRGTVFASVKATDLTTPFQESSHDSRDPT